MRRMNLSRKSLTSTQFRCLLNRSIELPHACSKPAGALAVTADSFLEPDLSLRASPKKSLPTSDPAFCARLLDSAGQSAPSSHIRSSHVPSFSILCGRRRIETSSAPEVFAQLLVYACSYQKRD